MSEELKTSRPEGTPPEPGERLLSDAARRALAEAQARRVAATQTSLPVEKGGRNGPEPVRYGDWEKNGIVSDF